MTDFPSKIRVFDVRSHEFIKEAHIGEALQDPDFPDVFKSRYEVSWLTGWKDIAQNDLWEGDVVKRVRDSSAEHQRLEYKSMDDPPEDLEDLVHDYSGGVAVVTWEDGGFTFDQLFGHKWSFYGPEGLNVHIEEEVKKIGSIHDTDINRIIESHRTDETS